MSDPIDASDAAIAIAESAVLPREVYEFEYADQQEHEDYPTPYRHYDEEMRAARTFMSARERRARNLRDPRQQQNVLSDERPFEQTREALQPYQETRNVVTREYTPPKFIRDSLDNEIVVGAALANVRSEIRETLISFDRYTEALRKHAIFQNIANAPQHFTSDVTEQFVRANPIRCAIHHERTVPGFAGARQTNVENGALKRAQESQKLVANVRRSQMMLAELRNNIEHLLPSTGVVPNALRCMYPRSEEDLSALLEECGVMKRALRVGALPTDFEKCTICMDGVEEDRRFVRIVEACSAHSTCSLHRKQCSCSDSVFFHYKCMAAYVIEHYKNNIEEVEGVQQSTVARALPRCPNCRGVFCITRLQLVVVEEHSQSTSDAPKTPVRRRKRRFATTPQAPRKRGTQVRGAARTSMAATRRLAEDLNDSDEEALNDESAEAEVAET